MSLQEKLGIGLNIYLNQYVGGYNIFAWGAGDGGGSFVEMIVGGRLSEDREDEMTLWIVTEVHDYAQPEKERSNLPH